MTHAGTIGLALFFGLGALAVAGPIADDEIVITFDKVETAKPMASYTDKGVVFALSRRPEKSRAAGRVMFFPHLKTARNGILNAMANESIPVEIGFPKPVASVTLVLWGSIGSAVLVEAYANDGRVVDKVSRKQVPQRTAPEQPVPSIELTVHAPAIAYVRFSGAAPGGYLVCDEVRFIPLLAPANERTADVAVTPINPFVAPAKQGMEHVAMDVSPMINNIARKDQALAMIAKGGSWNWLRCLVFSKAKAPGSRD
jgi:hypothetical protein